MRQRWLAALALAAALAAPAAVRAQDVCSSQKAQAAGRYFQARANCVAKALAKGLEPDALCITKALTKLQTSFQKAEAKGPCPSLADLAPVEDVLADALDDGFDAVSQVGATCCDSSTDVCSYRSAQACTDAGGTPGAPGTACQADGTCGPIDEATLGACCELEDLVVPGIQGVCATGPDIGALCISEGHPVVDGGNCHPEAGCRLASEPARSRCTSAKLKAQGRALAAAAKCHAKALKKSAPIDLQCLAAAESKLGKAFAAAEKKDDCLGRNDLAAALGVLNDARELAIELVAPTTTYCCEGVAGCFYTQTGPECSANGGTPVGTGECDADGTCKAPPLAEGGCCDGVLLGSLRCVGGATSVECTNLGGDFVDDALCTMAQVCID
jgi:hypothetical protein